MRNQPWVNWLLVTGLLITLAAGAYLLWPGGRATEQSPLDLGDILRLLDTEAGNAAPSPDKAHRYVFPADHGPHPQHRTEIWDLRAVLVGDEGEPIGLRATFLRLALAPPTRPKRASSLAADELIAGQVTLSLNGAKAASQHQRASRAVLGIAGSGSDPAAVWIEDWRLEHVGAGDWILGVQLDIGRIQLRLANAAPAGAVLTEDDLGPVNGSRIDAIHRYQQPRLAAAGTIGTGAGDRPVSGSAWLEHGWGDIGAILGGRQGQLRANRFQLRVKDDTTLHCIELRRIGGGGTPIPSCTLIAANGTRQRFQRRELRLTPDERTWRGPDGVDYPLSWDIAIPSANLTLRAEPLIEDQRLRLLDQPIWSGAVVVGGTYDGVEVTGSGWVELTGG
jgi:predicted secreted hydrolase